MKLLLFCNLIPLKTGAYETLLAAIGSEFKKVNDEFVVVFAGEPIPPVAESLRAAGVRWHILPEWVGRGGRFHWGMVSLGKKCNGSNPTTSFSLNPQSPISNLQSRERVRPWGFVLPALRLLRQERPDVAAVHFGNELPTLVVSLLSKVAMRNPPPLGLGTGSTDTGSRFHREAPFAIAPSQSRCRPVSGRVRRGAPIHAQTWHPGQKDHRHSQLRRPLYADETEGLVASGIRNGEQWAVGCE